MWGTNLVALETPIQISETEHVRIETWRRSIESSLSSPRTQHRFDGFRNCRMEKNHSYSCCRFIITIITIIIRIHTDYGSMDLPVSDTVGEESNILGSSTHQQILGDGDSFDVERKRPYDAAAAAEIVGDSSAPAPKSIIDAVAPAVDDVASASNQKIVSCYYRTLPYEGNELTFVYIKRMWKTVNMNISRIPWLIQRLSYYCSLKGDDMHAMGQALENCYNMYANVGSEIDESELGI
ncbi:unnamed protein product [Allacma fusca]|uniref:Uncharacterized protein n=1 Tax=Allacma fusca TaxID=39272 RepID=A0A8J2JXL3_9HEXA|nr:unnamed protein product [Allacma fusca]